MSLTEKALARERAASAETIVAEESEKAEVGATSELGNQPVLEHLPEQALKPDVPDVPYSVFQTWEKWVVVGLTSIAAIHSPLAANLYFPAIPILAVAFDKPIELINVTVTVYMLLQGLAPTVWGNLADCAWCGRRPIYLACLSLLSVSCIGLAMTPTSAYWLLVLLRCIQAAGSASVIALCSGSIMDIAASHERGIFLGISGIGPQLGTCIGPFIGGVLTGNLGWRSTFWFLCISAGVTFTLELLLLPETLRAIVGDGSIRAPRFNRPLIPILGRRGRAHVDPGKRPIVTRKHKPLDFLKLFRHKDLVIILWSNAVQFSVFYCVQATSSTLFLTNYPWLTETDVGLCYLAYGGGCIFGGPMSGRIMDWEYKRAKKRAEELAELGASPEGGYVNKEGVNVVHARLRVTPYYWILYVAIVIAYGWCAEIRAPLAVLLALQFCSMFFCMAIFNVTQVLIMDLFPGRGSTIAAANNVMRCLPGAVVVSIVQYILDGVGVGWTFTILALWCVVTYPLLIVEWRWGPEWARQREERESKQL